MYTMIPYRAASNAVRYNPFNDDLFRGFFPTLASTMRVDIQDQGDSYTLKADLPGYTKENIHIDLDEDVLTICADMNSDSEEKKDNGFVVRERRMGTVRRSFNVQGIDRESISAKYENGVLQLTLPKEKTAVETRKAIQIN